MLPVFGRGNHPFKNRPAFSKFDNHYRDHRRKLLLRRGFSRSQNIQGTLGEHRLPRAAVVRLIFYMTLHRHAADRRAGQSQYQQHRRDSCKPAHLRLLRLQLSDRNPDPPQRIRDRLPEIQPLLPPIVLRLLRTRRTVHPHPRRLQHSLHAINMISIAHHDAGF